MRRDRETSRRRRGQRREAPVVLALLCCVLAAACGAIGEPDATAAATAAPTTAPPEAAPTTAPPEAAPTTPPEAAPTTASPEPAPTGPAGGQAPVCVERPGCFGQPERAGTFDVTAVPEASGLAASQRNPGILWLLDDGPGTREVWALRTRGGLLGPVTVEGLDARDSESLAVGPCGPGEAASCVYVGDIGDNLRRRQSIAVHRFEEPDLSAGVPSEPVAAGVARFTYPGGQAHDAEALLVDASGALLVVTKAPFDAEGRRTAETRLYVAPRFADGVLEDRGPVPVPEPALPLHSRAVGNVVTGADARDGLVLLRTYDQVLLYVAPEAAAPLHGFPAWPVHEVPAALELQSEAIAWARDGCGYYTAGEQVGDVWFVPCVR